MGELWRRLYFLINRRRMERELAEEMAAHRDMMSDEYGTEFGNVLRLREESRDAWGWMWLDRLGQDLRYGVRMLRKSPLFTLAGIGVLALGIGVNIGAFQLFNLLLLKPLPVREPETLYSFSRCNQNNISNGVPYPEVEFLRKNAAPLAAIIAIKGGDLSWEDSPADRVHAQFVTANYFTELGAGAAWGRTLSAPIDESPSADPAVVLSYGFWQRRFGSDPSVVGKVIRLNKKPVTVAGVAPFDFTGLQPDNIDVWVPIHRQPYLVDGSKLLIDYESGVLLYGRLKPGMSPRATEDSLRPFVTTLREQHPKIFWDGEFLQAAPGAYLAHMEREAVPVIVMGSVLVLLVLVIACANLGNLQLARGLARASEMRIRSAVGAGRRRIVRQLLTESFLLAMLGSIAGLFLSFAVARAVLLALNAPQFLNPAFDSRVGLFVLAMACLATLFFGLTPALQATRPRGTGNRARLVLISGQIAASFILLVVSSLLVRGIDRFLNTSPGFEYRHVMSVDPALYEHGFTAAAASQYLQSTAVRLRQLPGIEAVALTTMPPLGNRGFNEGLDGYPGIQPCSNEVSPAYFETLAIPILEGRAFREGDHDVVVVSQSLARRLWPGENAIGKRYPRAKPLETVIGVAGNARTTALSDGQATEVYRPLSITNAAAAVFVVRSAVMPEAVANLVRTTVVAADSRTTPELALLETAFTEKTQTSRRGAFVVSVLGAVALLLAAIGIFGVVAYSVTQRTREIGLRVALGAKPGDVLAVVLRQFLIPAAVGLGAGIAGAAGLSLILRGQLYGLSNLDPLSYAAGLGMFGAVAAIAALWPARRALRVEPSTALRYE